MPQISDIHRRMHYLPFRTCSKSSLRTTFSYFFASPATITQSIDLSHQWNSRRNRTYRSTRITRGLTHQLYFSKRPPTNHLHFTEVVCLQSSIFYPFNGTFICDKEEKRLDKGWVARNSLLQRPRKFSTFLLRRRLGRLQSRTSAVTESYDKRGKVIEHHQMTERQKTRLEGKKPVRRQSE